MKSSAKRLAPPNLCDRGQRIFRDSVSSVQDSFDISQRDVFDRKDAAVGGSHPRTGPPTAESLP